MRYNKTDRDCRYRSLSEIVPRSWGNITLRLWHQAIFPQLRGN